MIKRIIVKSDRTLTDEEISEFEKKVVILSTESIDTSPHTDRFAGVSIGSRQIGATDYISYLSTYMRKIENQQGEEGDEYEVVIEETSPVRCLSRYKSGGKASGYNMEKIEYQLRHLRQTEFAELLNDPNVIEQIEKKYEEESQSDFFSTYYFSGDEQRETVLKEITDILTKIGLKGKFQLEEAKKDGQVVLLNIVKDPKNGQDMKIAFPCRLVFRLDKGQLKFEYVSSKEPIGGETKEEVVSRISKTNALMQIIGKSEKAYYVESHSFLIPEDILNEDDFYRVIEEMENMEIKDVNVDELNIEECKGLVQGRDLDIFIYEIIKRHDEEFTFGKIEEIKDNELKQKFMYILSEFKKDYTEEQGERIKQILTELLKDEKGWGNNARVISRFAKEMIAGVDFSKKMQLLQNCIEANNNELKQHNSNFRELEMDINPLIDGIFTDKEQVKLAEELISSQNYQAMMMILNCSGISTEIKDKIANVLIENKDNIPKHWTVQYYDVEYLRRKELEKEKKEKMDAYKKYTDGKVFFTITGYVETNIINEIGLQCFEIFDEKEKDWVSGYINVKEALKTVNRGKLHINIPQEYMGLMIGKGGQNIKRIQGKLKRRMDSDTNIDIKIILHPQQQGEQTITLKSIEKAIKEQRAQSHED